MDGGPAEPAGRHRRRPLASLPFGIAVAWLLARGRFWGKSLLDTLVHLPLILPPVVTGYLLLISFGRRGPIGAFLDRAFRHRLRLPLDRRGAGLRGDGLSADGARDPAVDRGRRPRLESAAGTLGANPLLGVRHRHPAVCPARHHRRRDPVLRQGDGRVRRHHHLRLQHPGRDPDPAVGDLHLHAGAGRRGRRAAADRWCRSRSRWRRCSPRSCWRGASASGSWRHEPRGRRRARARRASVSTRASRRRRADRAVRPLGLRQDHAGQHHRRADPARARPHRRRRRRCWSTPSAASSCRSTAAASATSSRTAACSRI